MTTQTEPVLDAAMLAAALARVEAMHSRADARRGTLAPGRMPDTTEAPLTLGEFDALAAVAAAAAEYRAAQIAWGPVWEDRKGTQRSYTAAHDRVTRARLALDAALAALAGTGAA